MQKLQSTCSKKFKKILDENKSLKSELSEIKTLLVGKLKANKDILSDKQPDTFQGESSRDPMVDDQYDDSTEKRSLLALLVLLVLNEEKDPRASLVVVCQGHTNRVVLDSGASLSLLFHGHDKLFFDIRASAFEEKNARAEDLLPFPLVEEFSKSSPYSELQVNFYLEKGIAQSENDTLPIRMVDELPQQTQCDCGVFVCTFAEYVIHDRDIPKEINIGHVRMRYGALLWDYEMRKLEAGIKDNTTEKIGRLFGKEKRKRTHQE
ncbi:hypothetical protein CQW23_09637 [Capsicum baccatum]|uniref:Ubiquitin-like protease family profile domain-containing protein n=1 Tax=Capsicum baccatum TaxID=33114 RepID=A0A2G2WXH3_CAPBA|nr:hypothetical protein CQW23_09637 [Capsicum baccatum]